MWMKKMSESEIKVGHAESLGEVRVEAVLKPERVVLGIHSNSCTLNNEEHNLFLDCDKISLKKCRENIVYLQGRYGLPTMQVWESSPGKYWITCFCRLSLKQIVRITLDERIIIDDAYRSHVIPFGFSTLRLSAKLGKKIVHVPRMVSEIHNKNSKISEDVDCKNIFVSMLSWERRSLLRKGFEVL